MSRRAGVVAVLGAPNAGKSTIVNALVGQKVAITSRKAQTTRTRLMGVAMEGETQILLVDTPGIFNPRRRLDRAMVAAAWDSAEDADILALVVDSAGGLEPRVGAILDGLKERRETCWLILNKVDLVAKDKLLGLAGELNERANFAESFFVSATTGDGMAELKSAMAAAMPEGEWLFPEDQVSDVTERLLAAEITREQIYAQLHEELPYESSVVGESYAERPDGSIEIRQQILVAKASQRAIVLGKGGQRIKEIGKASREELSRLLGRKVHLFLHVKVKPDWDSDKGLYRDFGLEWVE